MDKRVLRAACLVLALIATPAQAATPTVKPSPTPAPPLHVPVGMTLRVNADEPDASGQFHCDYVTPSMRLFLGLPQRIVWVCGR